MNYIDEHMRLFAGERTPLSYDIWSALFAIGTVVGRTCYIDLPTPIFLNPYIVLTTSMEYTIREQTTCNVTRDLIRRTMINDITSDGPLTRVMVDNYDAIGHGQVAMIGSPYVRTFRHPLKVKTLITMADCPTTWSKVRNPYVTVLTQANIRELKPTTFNPHIVGLTLYIIPRGKKDIGNNKLALTLLDDTAYILRGIACYGRDKQTLRIDYKAEALLTKYHNSLQPTSGQPYTEAFEARQLQHTARVAALRSLARLSNTVDADDVIFALDLITRAKKDGQYLFQGTGTKDPNVIVVLRDLIEKARTLSVPMIVQRMQKHAVSYELRGIIYAMRDLGMIVLIKAKGGPFLIKSATFYDEAYWEKLCELTGFIQADDT